MSLPQDIQDVPLSIHCPPQIVLLFLFRYYHLIEMPFVRNVSTFAPKLIRVLLSKPMTPFPNRFIPHLDSAIEHHFFDVPLAEGKGVVEPHTG